MIEGSGRPAQGRRLRVCLAGTWDPAFGRNVILQRLLALAGCDVVLCRVELWPERGDAIVRRSRLRLIGRTLLAYPLLAWRFMRSPRPDVVIVPYPGHFDMPLVRLLCAVRRVPLVFDMFISLYDTIVCDRRLAAPRSMTGRLARGIDRLACRAAAVILADTPQHADYFSQLSGVPRDRFRVLWVGTREHVFQPRPDSTPDPDVVLFYGSYIPLHGVETIVRAAASLAADGVVVRIIGDGQERGRIGQIADELGVTNVEWVGTVPLQQLADEIARAGICLGIFGTTAKADRVVPNKLYECIAMGRPVVTGDTSAIRSAFADGELATVPAGDPAALAAAVLALRADPERRERIAAAGRRRFVRDYAEQPLARLLHEQLHAIVDARG